MYKLKDKDQSAKEIFKAEKSITSDFEHKLLDGCLIVGGSCAGNHTLVGLGISFKLSVRQFASMLYCANASACCKSSYGMRFGCS